MNQKKRLGRGLGALIPEASSETDINEISIHRIKPNPYQPRLRFDETKLRELAESIKEHGVVQAVVVSPEGDNYVLVAGERRFRAAQMVGLQTIPAVIKELSESAMLEIALIENLQREDLNPIEEASAYRRLMDEFNLTQEELARRVGKSRSAIANTVRLLALSKPIIEALVRGDINAGQARPLAGLTDAAAQEKAALLVLSKGLTAREVEKMVAEMGQGKEQHTRQDVMLVVDPHHKEMQELLQRRLGTKVKMNQGKQGGSFEIFFYGEADLERLLALLLPEGIS